MLSRYNSFFETQFFFTLCFFKVFSLLIQVIIFIFTMSRFHGMSRALFISPCLALAFHFPSSYTPKAVMLPHSLMQRYVSINNYSFKPLRFGMMCYVAIVLIPFIENNRIFLLLIPKVLSISHWIHVCNVFFFFN